MRRLHCLALLAILSVAGCGRPSPTTEPPAGPPSAAPGSAVEADYVRLALDGPPSGSPLLSQKKPLPTAAAIIGPQYAVAFDWTSTVARIDESDALAMGLPGPVAAPAGSELLLAHLAPAQPRALRTTTTRTPDARLIVGGKPRPSSLRFTKDAVLIVAAPTAAPVLLSMTDSGRTQTLDLRTGTRGPDANPLFYIRYAADEFQLRTGLRPQAPGQITVTGKLTLLPWTADHGWAPAGRAWLHFDGHIYQMLGYTDGETMDLARSISVAAGGKAYAPMPDRYPVPDSLVLSTATLTYAFDVAVPAGFRSGTMRLDPKMTCHGCETGTAASTKISLSAGPVPMATS